MSNTPQGWRIAKLDDIATVQTGIAVSGDAERQDPVILPYLRVANVQDGHIDLTEVKNITISRSQIGRYSLRAGDVLMTEGGDFDKLGRGAVWNGQIEPCLHQNHIFAVRPDGSLLLSDFLAAYCESGPGKRYFLSCSKQTTNLASINSTQLKAMPVVVPPIIEQRRIVAALNAWDQTIAQTEQLIVAKRQRYRALIARYSKEFHSQRIEFGQLVDLISDRLQPGVGNAPSTSIELENIESETGRLLGTENVGGDSALRSQFAAGDTLFGKLRPYLRKFLRPQFDGICSTEIWVLRAKRNKLDPALLFFLVQTPDFDAAATKQTGSRMPRADWDVVSSAPIPCPADPEEQSQFAALLTVALNTIHPELTRLSSLRLQKRALMQKLLTGATRLDERFDHSTFVPGAKNSAKGSQGSTRSGAAR